jgi:uncharacterized HAD superfamily protein
MIFGFDLDGCVIHFLPTLLKTIENLFGFVCPEKYVHSWNIYNVLPISKEQEDEAVAVALRNWTDWKPYPNALKIVETYYKITGNIVYFITSREEKFRNCTLDWLDSYLDPHIVYELVMDADKPKEIKQRQISYFIEDRPPTILKIAETGTTVFVPDRPWNWTIYSQNNIIKFTDWNDIHNFMYEELSKEKVARLKEPN